jgi:lysophospholipid acyltransferase (LPLAT)-like uncharacterized protein
MPGQFCALVAPPLLNLLDYRLFYFDRSTDPARAEYDEHCIFVFWHEYISVILPRWGHTPLTVLCSKHRDGEIVNQIALGLGFHIVRGSSNRGAASRGGADAIRQLRKNACFSSIAITPDGPRGPRREMAVGPLYLASLMQMPIVPIGIGIDRAWRLDTWDQFALPKPFSRVRLILGPKIYMAPKQTREQLETCRNHLTRLMNDLTHHAQNWAESGLAMSGEQTSVRVRRNNKKWFERPMRATLPEQEQARAEDIFSARPNNSLSKMLSAAKAFGEKDSNKIRA